MSRACSWTAISGHARGYGRGAPSARPALSAMIDLSDGLATDAAHMAEASGVRLRVELERLPLASGVTPEEGATGGDDYELLVAMAPGDREAAEAAGVAWIGEVAAGEGLVLVGEDGRPVEGLRGFEHA